MAGTEAPSLPADVAPVDDGAVAIDVSKHFGLAHAVAWRYRRWAEQLGLTLDDITSTAYYGLLLGAKSYDPARGVKPSTHMTTWAVGAVRNSLRRWRILHPLPAGDDGEELEIRAKPEPDLATRLEIADAVRKALPPREALIVLRHFGFLTGEAETLAAIAEDLGVGRERCRQLLERATERLSGVRALQQLAD
jgi:RNA polymerase sigma factor (sigma-70 family)